MSERKIRPDLLLLGGLGPNDAGQFCGQALSDTGRQWTCLRSPNHEGGHYFGLEGESLPEGITDNLARAAEKQRKGQA